MRANNFNKCNNFNKNCCNCKPKPILKFGKKFALVAVSFGAMLFVTNFCSFEFIITICALVIIALGLYIYKC